MSAEMRERREDIRPSTYVERREKAFNKSLALKVIVA